jgi:single-strand DNA-binding protein
MAHAVNNVTISGRLGREVKIISDGDEDPKKCMIGFTVAINVYDPKAEKKEKAVWVDVVAFGSQAHFATRHLDKGSRVIVEGSLDSRSWADKESGDKRTVLQVRARQVHVVDFKGGEDGERRTSRKETAREEEDFSVPASGGEATSEFDLD